MAGGGKHGGGDRVLESRHLVGLFLGVVLLCGVFFTLGYVMGRTQYGGSVHAESPARMPVGASTVGASTPIAPPANTAADSAKPAPAASVPNEWDFYSKKNDDQDKLAPSKQVAANHPAAAAPPDSSEPAATLTPVEREQAGLTHVKAPAPAPAFRPTKNSIVLQVAALRHQSDALTMADLLQKKRFPAFVVAPASGDPLYHVQVGPYTDERTADAARAALDHDGFKAILKH
jgi:hypothetical protein